MCLKVVCNVGIFLLEMVATWGPNQVKLHVEGLQGMSSNHQKSTRTTIPQKTLLRQQDHWWLSWTLQFWNPLITNRKPWEPAVSPPFNPTGSCPTTPVSALQSPCCRLSAWHRAPWLGETAENSSFFGGPDLGICLGLQKFHGFSKINKIKHPFQEAPISWDSNLVQSIKSEKQQGRRKHQVKDKKDGKEKPGIKSKLRYVKMTWWMKAQVPALNQMTLCFAS